MTRHTTIAILFSFVVASVLPLAATVGAQDDSPLLGTRDDPTLGSVLNDASGWTLYTFANDGPEASACTASCSAVWPPLLVDGNMAQPDLPGALTSFPRDDGSMQAAYNLAPLYYYSGDVQPGDTNGQGVAGVWFAAASGLAPAAPSQPAQAPAPPAVQQPTAAPAATQPPAAPARPTPPVNSTGPAPAATSAPAATAAPTAVPAPTSAPYIPPRMGY